MNPKFPCRSVVTLTPKLSEQQYALRLVVVPCQYLPSTSPFFQPISPYPSSHISYIAVLYLLRRRRNTCCPASPPPCFYASIFTADLVCHPHYLRATIRPQFGSRPLSIFPSPLQSFQAISPSPSSHISSAAISIPVVPHLCHHAHPPLSSPLTLYAIPIVLHLHRDSQLLSSRLSVAVLIALSSIVPCTSPPFFFYLLRSDILLYLRCSVLHCLLLSASHYFS